MSNPLFELVRAWLPALAPWRKAVTITPSDTVELPIVTRGIMSLEDGDVTVLLLENVPGEEIVLSLEANVDRPFAVRKVYATGTDNIIIKGLY